MSNDVCIGPNGGCPICYHKPCTCRETDAARIAKIRKAVGREVQLLKCDDCNEFGVVADDVVRAYVCLKCGQQQKPKWSPAAHGGTAPHPEIVDPVPIVKRYLNAFDLLPKDVIAVTRLAKERGWNPYIEGIAPFYLRKLLEAGTAAASLSSSRQP